MNREEKSRLIRIRLAKAEESYQIAEEMYADHPAFSINRYYYALYYAISAVLVFTTSESKSHKGIITAFNKELVKPGYFNKDDGRLLMKVFQWRTKSDYDDSQEYTVEDVATIRLPVGKLLIKLKEHAASQEEE